MLDEQVVSVKALNESGVSARQLATAVGPTVVLAQLVFVHKLPLLAAVSVHDATSVGGVSLCPHVR